jgi:hypothetical protein
MSFTDPTVSDLILSFSRAMLGEVPWALRRVTARVQRKTIKVQFVFDGPISDDDRDSGGCIAAEVIADFPEHMIDEEYLRLDEPQEIPFLGEEWRVIFQRKEPRSKALEQQ